MDLTVSRKMHRTLEPYHILVYLIPEAEETYTDLGLAPGMGYFASRAAPMGPVPAEVVIATFYGFQPDYVRSFIPAAWALASPEEILAARLVVVDRGLRRILGDEACASSEVIEAAELARQAAAACACDGRALYAAHASLPWPTEPHLELWHALTLIREFRGDGHNAALVASGTSGCEAMIMHQATGEITPFFASTRNWSPQQWAAGVSALQARGWLDEDEQLTDAGRQSRAWVEEQTDRLVLPCWVVLGEERCTRLRALVRPFSRKISEVALTALTGPG
jgi:hypothetical protein